MIFLILKIVKEVRTKINLNNDSIKNVFLFCSVILTMFFFCQNKYYKSVINNLKERERAFISNTWNVNDLDRIVSDYLKESLNEDILLSSNDIFHLNRSIGLSN